MNALVQQARVARDWSSLVTDYVFANREVWRTEFDIITCERSSPVLVASCATQDAALAVLRLMQVTR